MNIIHLFPNFFPPFARGAFFVSNPFSFPSSLPHFQLKMLNNQYGNKFVTVLFGE